MTYLPSQLLLISSILVVVTCYKTYSSLNSIIFTNIDEVADNVHSEYFYGKCATRDKKLVLHDTLTYEDIQGKMVVRAYLNSTKPISCIYVRSQSPLSEMVKYQPSRFTMCLSKIRYQYLGKQYIYHFYEWFLPVEMRSGMDWDLYFFSNN